MSIPQNLALKIPPSKKKVCTEIAAIPAQPQGVLPSRRRVGVGMEVEVVPTQVLVERDAAPNSC